MLKLKISEDEFDSLSDEMKKIYKQDGDSYLLDADIPNVDNGALKRAKDRESQKRKDLEAQLAELQSKLDSISDTDARKRGDIDTLEKSWNSKYSDMEKSYGEKMKSLQSAYVKEVIDKKAIELANKLSDSPDLILPHIKGRIKADFDGDTPITRVLDKEGNVSALTFDELHKEFVANPIFKPIIRESKASGSSANNASGQKGSANKSLKDMTATEQAIFANQNPELYLEMKKAQGHF